MDLLLEEIALLLLTRAPPCGCLADSYPRDRTHLWPPALPVARLPDARLQPPGGSRPAPTGPLPHLLTQGAECRRLPAQRPVQSKWGSGYLRSKRPFAIRPFSGGDLSEEVRAEVSRMLWFKLQARILEWVAIPFCRRFPQSRDGTQVFRIAGRFFTS